VFHADFAGVEKVYDTFFARELAHFLALFGGFDVLVGREMVEHKRDLFPVENAAAARLAVFVDRHGRGDVVGKHQVKVSQNHVAGRDALPAAVGRQDFLAGSHTASLSFLLSKYSMESVSAFQLAAMMSVETPTVVQVSVPSVLSMSTRTFAAEAFSAVSTRTL